MAKKETSLLQEIYLESLIEENFDNICVSDAQAYELLKTVDERLNILQENWVDDVGDVIFWTILDIVAIFLPYLKGLKGLKGTKGGIKICLKNLRGRAKAYRKLMKSATPKNLRKLTKSLKWTLILANFAQAFCALNGTEWEGEKFGRYVELPLLDGYGESLTKWEKIGRGAGKTAEELAGFVVAPLGYIGEFTDKLRNAARTLSQQMLSAINKESFERIDNEGGGWGARLFKKINTMIKNTFFNNKTKTDSVYFPEFFDLCKEKGLDLTKITTYIGEAYAEYFTETFGKFENKKYIEKAVYENVKNAADFLHLDYNIMSRAAFKRLGSVIPKTSASTETSNASSTTGNGTVTSTTTNTPATQPTAPSNPVAIFQQWANANNYTGNDGKPLQVDGKLNSTTVQAIMKFQTNANKNGYRDKSGAPLTVHGMFDPATQYVFNLIKSGQKPESNTQPQYGNVAEDMKIKGILNLMERIEKTFN